LLRLCSSSITGKEEVKQQGEIPKSNPIVVMINASQQQALRKKPKAGNPPMAPSAIAKMTRAAYKNQQKEHWQDASL
jgi:hypothetical protein